MLPPCFTGIYVTSDHRTIWGGGLSCPGLSCPWPVSASLQEDSLCTRPKTVLGTPRLGPRAHPYFLSVSMMLGNRTVLKHYCLARSRAFAGCRCLWTTATTHCKLLARSPAEQLPESRLQAPGRQPQPFRWDHGAP